MDLVDLMAEKRFVGQEFLTWLWFKSEERGNAIALPLSQTDIELTFERHLMLESGEGSDLERLICQGEQCSLLEARTGLAAGKKIEQARMMLVRDEHEFHFTITGSLFEFRSVRLPKVMASGEDELDQDGRVLDVLGLHELLIRTMDELFKVFLQVVLSDSWPREVERMRVWMNRPSNVAA